MTVQTLWTIIVSIACGFGALIGVYQFFASQLKTREAERNKELLEKIDDLRKEIEKDRKETIAVVKLCLTMANELEQSGEVNGETQKKIDELHDLFYNQ